MKKTTFLIIVAFSYVCLGQPNCFIYPEGSGEKKACELCHEAVKFKQGSKASQELFDEAISIGPEFAWSYYQKSVPYLKRGFLSKGLKILNKAIEINPLEYLCYRAYWYWQYRNYMLCIKDLERFYTMPKSYYHTTPGGDKDMRIILGLAYAKAGKFDKAIETISNTINSYEDIDDVGYTDYLSLGIVYYLNDDFDKAIKVLNTQKQIIKDVSETYYFLGLCYAKKSENLKAKKQIQTALSIYSGINRFKIINPGFRVYKSDVEDALAMLENQ